MRGYQLKTPGPVESAPLEQAELPDPAPGTGEIAVAVRFCGLCHTDLHTIEGDFPLPKLPVVPGHQIVGVVAAVGAGTSRFEVGQRVGIPWLNRTCGRCDYCRRGSENLCEAAAFTGLHVDGGYAERTVVHEDFAYPIPDGFPDHQAAPLLCAGIIGYRSLELSGVRSGETLGLYGFGASAHIVIQIARHRGCRVRVFTRSPGHQRLAAELGAEVVGRAEEADPESLHSTIIFAPAGELVPLALRALRKGGTIALAGIHMSPIPEMDYSLLYGERTLRTVANSTRRDAEELLKLAVEIPIKIKTEVFKFDDLNRALARLKAGSIDGAGVLEISPSG